MARNFPGRLQRSMCELIVHDLNTSDIELLFKYGIKSKDALRETLYTNLTNNQIDLLMACKLKNLYDLDEFIYKISNHTVKELYERSHSYIKHM